MRIARFQIADGDAAVWAVTLAAAWGLKSFYSAARFDALRWILTPTVRLVERGSGVRFELSPHEGWLCREHGFLVAPVCAGVNFMIVAFVSLCLGLTHACANSGARVALVAGSAAAAYGATLLANATRIAIAVRLQETGAALGPLTPERLHLVLGIAVYLVFLLALFAVAERAVGARRALV